MIPLYPGQDHGCEANPGSSGPRGRRNSLWMATHASTRKNTKLHTDTVVTGAQEPEAVRLIY